VAIVPAVVLFSRVNDSTIFEETDSPKAAHQITQLSVLPDRWLHPKLGTEFLVTLKFDVPANRSLQVKLNATPNSTETVFSGKGVLEAGVCCSTGLEHASNNSAPEITIRDEASNNPFLILSTETQCAYRVYRNKASGRPCKLAAAIRPWLFILSWNQLPNSTLLLLLLGDKGITRRYFPRRPPVTTHSPLQICRHQIACSAGTLQQR
jgi:hypothetical protein